MTHSGAVQNENTKLVYEFFFLSEQFKGSLIYPHTWTLYRCSGVQNFSSSHHHIFLSKIETLPPGVGSLLARFQLSDGPSKPAPLAVQFTSEGSTLSGCDIELAGPGYRFSLIKKRFAAGQFAISGS